MSGDPRQGVRTISDIKGATAPGRSGLGHIAGWHRQGQHYLSNLDYAELPRILVLSVLIGGLFAFIV